MATFDEAQVTSLASMFGSNSDAMSYHLEGYEELITESDKTAVLAQITRYSGGTVKGRVWFEGKESNEGFNMSPVFVADNRDPREIIAGLIQWPWNNAYGSYSMVRS
jgi:hypothetical protein